MLAVKEDLLERSIDRVRQTLAENADGRGIGWVCQVGQRVEELIEALRSHASPIEEPDSIYAMPINSEQDIDSHFDQHAQHLRDEFVDLLDNADGLLEYVEDLHTRYVDRVIDEIDQQEVLLLQELAEEILIRAEAHCECETELYV